jgi:hypothetical protein
MGGVEMSCMEVKDRMEVKDCMEVKDTQRGNP